MNTPNAVLALHDLSCFGRSALQVIIPSLTSFGLLTCPVPTAVLSTHTGGFEDFTFYDLSQHMKAQLHHWQTLDLSFQAIYPGFLGSSEQVSIVKDYIKAYKKEETLLLVDPVLGDEGRKYTSITDTLVEEMRELISGSDYITPNLTEANLLLNKPAHKIPEEKDYANYLTSLSQLGAKNVLITSIDHSKKNKMTLLYYDGQNDLAYKLLLPKVPATYPGTGDIFCSLLIGHLLNQEAIQTALLTTTSFLYRTIAHTYEKNTPHREGLLVEPFLAKRSHYEQVLPNLKFQRL